MRTEKICPWDHVWHFNNDPQTDFSIRTSYPWKILIFFIRNSFYDKLYHSGRLFIIFQLVKNSYFIRWKNGLWPNWFIDHQIRFSKLWYQRMKLKCYTYILGTFTEKPYYKWCKNKPWFSTIYIGDTMMSMMLFVEKLCVNIFLLQF